MKSRQQRPVVSVLAALCTTIFLARPKISYVGALIIAYAILGVPYYDYSIIGPKTIKAAIVLQGFQPLLSCEEQRLPESIDPRPTPVLPCRW